MTPRSEKLQVARARRRSMIGRQEDVATGFKVALVFCRPTQLARWPRRSAVGSEHSIATSSTTVRMCRLAARAEGEAAMPAGGACRNRMVAGPSLIEL